MQLRLSAKVCGLIFAAVSIFSLPLFVQANDKDAVNKLRDMSVAMRSLNYEGTFVQIRNGHTDLLHILHAYDESGNSERMRSLNGEAREVIRNNSTVVRIWPSSGDVLVSSSKPFSLNAQSAEPFETSSNYTIVSGGEERVAGIETDVIDVQPVDDFRYGYRFWVDQDTGMMLRSMVMSSENQRVEELMFTSIEYLDEIDATRFGINIDAESTEQGHDKPSDGSVSVVDKVRFEDLPIGFEERSESLRMVAVRKDAPISHSVVSDGFSTVSVYVEYIERASHDSSALGLTHMGAVSAFGLSLPNALVTVVGEAPGKTVEMIARAARLVN